MQMLLLMFLQIAANAAPSEAQQLGIRLARTSGLAAVAPALIEKDLADLASEMPPSPRQSVSGSSPSAAPKRAMAWTKSSKPSAPATPVGCRSKTCGSSSPTEKAPPPLAGGQPSRWSSQKPWARLAKWT